MSKLKQKKYKDMKFTEWKTTKLEELENAFDEERKEIEIEKLRQDFKDGFKKQILGNIHSTLSDAKKMFAFFDEFLCKN